MRGVGSRRIPEGQVLPARLLPEVHELEGEDYGSIWWYDQGLETGISDGSSLVLFCKMVFLSLRKLRSVLFQFLMKYELLVFPKEGNIG